MTQSPEPKAVALLKSLLMPAVPPEVDEGTRLAADLHHDRDLEYLRP